MVSAVASSTFSYPALGAGASATLDAQLAKYEAQLADWVNCPSCKTPEGKAKVAEISAKISDVKQRIQSAESNKPVSAANNPSAVSVNSDQEPTTSNTSGKLSHDSAASPVSAPGAVGNRVNVYA